MNTHDTPRAARASSWFALWFCMLVWPVLVNMAMAVPSFSRGGGTVSGAMTGITSICNGSNCIDLTGSTAEFSLGYSVASGPTTTSGASVMPDGFQLIDTNGDGAEVDTGTGSWVPVVAGTPSATTGVDWDNQRITFEQFIARSEIRCNTDGACTVGSSSGSVKALYLKEQSSAPAATSGDAAIYAKTDDTVRANDQAGTDQTITLGGAVNWTP